MRSETLTNVFWGLFLVWFGLLAALYQGNLEATINAPTFALGTGILLLLLNLIRTAVRQRPSILTIGLGALLTVIFSPIVFFGMDVPFLPALLIIVGLALIIGAFRSRSYP